jgi:hypothetical protein
MKLPPRHLPLVTLLVGLCALAGLGAYWTTSRSVSPTALSIIFVFLGVSLAIVQIYSGFALQRGRNAVSRVEDPFSYWTGFFCSTVPFIVFGVVVILVR